LHVHGSGIGFFARPLPFLPVNLLVDAVETSMTSAVASFVTSTSVRARLTGGGTAISLDVTFEDPGRPSYVALRRGLLGPADLVKVGVVG
jgi:hypothetical protein